MFCINLLANIYGHLACFECSNKLAKIINLKNVVIKISHEEDWYELYRLCDTTLQVGWNLYKSVKKKYALKNHVILLILGKRLKGVEAYKSHVSCSMLLRSFALLMRKCAYRNV